MHALILAGGSGTRFWPASRRSRPKQFLDLGDFGSLYQATLQRLQPLVEPSSIWVSTTADLRSRVLQQSPIVPSERVLAEPAGRNTLAAIAWSVSVLPESVRSEVLAVLPSDHWVEDAAAFRSALERAARAAEGETIVTLGVPPRYPETGYGYLELEKPASGGEAVPVVRFTEKPDAATVERFVDGGKHLWNAGIFVFRGTTFLRLLEETRPDFAAAVAALPTDRRLVEAYRRLPAEPIDTGLMERLKEIWTVPVECGWSDLGSWSSVASVLDRDEAGNRVRGETLALDARDNLLYSEEGLVAVLGIEGLVVVKTREAVLVLPKERAQEVRRLVDALSSADRDDLL